MQKKFSFQISQILKQDFALYLLRLNNEEIKFSGDMNYTSLAAGVAVPFAGLAFKGKNVSCKPGMQFKYKLAHDVAVERY